jgi:hypothetical protein
LDVIPTTVEPQQLRQARYRHPFERHHHGG